MPIDTLQLEAREIGRIRTGDAKGKNGSPRTLDKFRLTSPDRSVLEAAAILYGGKVQPWREGEWELYTESRELPCMVAPQEGSEWFEAWKKGGILRRCNGITETLSGEPCMCDPKDRICKPTTRLNVFLPDLPGLGVWLVASRSWAVAKHMPADSMMLRGQARRGNYIRAILAIEQKAIKKEGKPTMQFTVPVLRSPVSISQMIEGNMGAAQAQIEAPRRAIEAARPSPANTFRETLINEVASAVSSLDWLTEEMVSEKAHYDQPTFRNGKFNPKLLPTLNLFRFSIYLKTGVDIDDQTASDTLESARSESSEV